MKVALSILFAMALLNIAAAQKFSPATASLKLFAAYKPTIEKRNDALVQPPKAITGDINGDGKEDCLLFFVLTPKEGGNAVIGRETAVYLNTGKGMKVAGSFPKTDECYAPARIAGGLIYATNYECAPPYNERIGELRFRYTNGRVQLTK